MGWGFASRNEADHFSSFYLFGGKIHEGTTQNDLPKMICPDGLDGGVASIHHSFLWDSAQSWIQSFANPIVKSIQFRHRVITWDISKHNGPTPRRFHFTFQHKSARDACSKTNSPALSLLLCPPAQESVHVPDWMMCSLHWLQLVTHSNCNQKALSRHRHFSKIHTHLPIGVDLHTSKDDSDNYCCSF